MNISRFYSELLDYFSELRDQYRDDCFKGDLIIWNNQDITIEGKSLYWKKCRECGIYFVQDLLKNTGKYLSYEEFKTKYNIEVNFIYYCQILSAIPKNLKFKAMTTKILQKQSYKNLIYTSLPKEKPSFCLKCGARIITHSSK